MVLRSHSGWPAVTIDTNCITAGRPRPPLLLPITSRKEIGKHYVTIAGSEYAPATTATSAESHLSRTQLGRWTIPAQTAVEFWTNGHCDAGSRDEASVFSDLFG